MFNIKKQIRRLYASSVLSCLSLTGAWVAILAQRGFSLAQIGFAETIFHITSLIFEIPSGVIADVFGRKKTLIASAFLRIIADVVMIFSADFAEVCVSMIFHALNYNFASGSDDALAYDSLKTAAQTSYFERYASNQLVIYRVFDGISTLFVGFSLFLGYKIAYGAGILLAIFQIVALSGLVEIRSEEKGAFSVRDEIVSCAKNSLLFLRSAKKALILMFANSIVGALDILLLFFLQAKLQTAGIANWTLGPALLFMQTGGVLGARIILCAKKARYRAVFALCFAIILSGILLEHSAICALMIAGGFIAALADDALQVRTNAILQDMFPSEERATLVSVESFSFSAVMTILSPLAGFFFSFW